MSLLDLPIGTRVTRAEINSRYGGGPQGGMLTPAGGALMLLYSDHSSAKTYGYTTDGWADADRTRYDYTGEGAVGPQSVDRGKNKILLESIDSGREVHLFYAVGTVPGTGTRIHEYLGQFEVDPSDPWRPEETLDQEGQPRTAVVFHLRRVGASASPSPAAQVEADQPVATTDVTPIAREAADKLRSNRRGVDPLVAERRERQFEDEMIDWLLAQGHATSRLRIQIAGELGTLITDTWMPESRTLLEAKGDATRNDIRMAVAQLLDYRRHITPAPLRSTVVVPIAPSQDLHDFVRSAGLSLAVFDSRGLTYLVE